MLLRVNKMQVFSDIIEGGADGVLSTFLPLSNQPMKEVEMTAKRLPPGSQDNQCSVDGCPAKCYARNVCERHYYHLRKNGGDFSRAYPGMGRNRVERFWDNINKNGTAQPHMDSPCWEWTSRIDKDGYGAAYYVINGRQYQTAHRVAYYFHYGTMPESYLVCHKCDNRKCCNPNHLYLGTKQDNATDARNRKRMPRGEQMHNTYLTELQVREIRVLRAFGLQLKQIGEMYNANYRTIGHIVSYFSWRYVV